jgi:hypothetical protein
MNNFAKPLIGGEKREEGILQIWFQSTDTVKRYSTGLGGYYDLTLLDIKVISASASAEEYAVQIISDTLRLDRGNLNDNIKFVHRNGAPELPNPIKLRQADVKNWIDVDFQQIGSVQDNINGSAYNVLLTIGYEKL